MCLKHVYLYLHVDWKFLIDFHMFNHPCILEINPTCSWQTDIPCFMAPRFTAHHSCCCWGQDPPSAKKNELDLTLYEDSLYMKTHYIVVVWKWTRSISEIHPYKFFIICSIWFVLCWVFLHLFIREIGLQYSVLMISLSNFCIRLILAFQNELGSILCPSIMWKN